MASFDVAILMPIRANCQRRGCFYCACDSEWAFYSVRLLYHNLYFHWWCDRIIGRHGMRRWGDFIKGHRHSAKSGAGFILSKERISRTSRVLLDIYASAGYRFRRWLLFNKAVSFAHFTDKTPHEWSVMRQSAPDTADIYVAYRRRDVSLPVLNIEAKSWNRRLMLGLASIFRRRRHRLYASSSQ